MVGFEFSRRLRGLPSHTIGEYALVPAVPTTLGKKGTRYDLGPTVLPPALWRSRVRHRALAQPPALIPFGAGRIIFDDGDPDRLFLPVDQLDTSSVDRPPEGFQIIRYGGAPALLEVAHGAQGDVGAFGQLVLAPIQPPAGRSALLWC